MIIAYAGELGLPVSTGYLMNVEPEERDTTIAAARFLVVVLGTVLVVGSIVATQLLPLPTEARGLSIAFSVFAIMNLFQRVHLAILQADLRLSAFNRVRMAGAATYLGLLVVYLITGTATPTRVVLSLLVANAVWCVLSGRLAFSRPFILRDRARIKALMRYGIRAHAGNVSAVDALKLDQLVLALFLSTHALGLYVVAMTVMMGNRMIGISVGMVGFPIAARTEGRGTDGRGTEGRRQLWILLLGTLVACGVVALLEVLFSRQILRTLFGADFAAGGTALQILAVGSVFVSLRQVYADWLRGSGRPSMVAVSELVAICVLVVLSLVLWDGSIDRVAMIMSISAVAALAWLAAADRLLGDGGRRRAGEHLVD